MQLNSLSKHRRWVLIGNPDCRRVRGFQAALASLKMPAAKFVSYEQLLTGTTPLMQHLTPDSLVRFESAAEDGRTRRLLLQRGYTAALAEGYPAATETDLAAVPVGEGLLLWPRQLYLGFAQALREWEQELHSTSATCLNYPSDISLLFDKPRCQVQLANAGISIPRIVGIPQTYEQVRNSCCRNGRYMVKLAHGSGAAGCVALHWQQGRVRALTALHQFTTQGRTWWFTSQKVRQLLDEKEIAALLNALCVERVHLEEWLPKVRLNGASFDLRIVTIGGEARHAVPRLSHSPFTNLNLGNRRGELPAVQNLLGDNLWQRIELTCQKVATVFPRSWVLGIDVLVTPQRQHFVLEANAFGDLLPGILHRGEETYAAEISAMKQRPPASLIAAAQGAETAAP